jgi:hypothetical protein
MAKFLLMADGMLKKVRDFDMLDDRNKGDL